MPLCVFWSGCKRDGFIAASRTIWTHGGTRIDVITGSDGYGAISWCHIAIDIV